MKNIKKISKNITEFENMAKHCSFNLGGTARFFALPKTIYELKKILKFCRKYNIKHFILGKGSNTVFKDNGYNGVVISLSKLCNKITKISRTKIKVGSGVNLYSLHNYCKNNNLSGLEFAFGIPASVGGAVFMNCGAYNGEIGNFVKKVRVLSKGKCKTLAEKDLQFAYRYSNFQQSGDIILDVIFEFYNDTNENIAKKQKAFITQRQETQPLREYNAGSVFKREKNIIPAKIIDKLGLKNVNIGGVEVSKKHAGFIVNNNHGTATDLINLIEHIKTIVKQNENIDLTTEIIIIGD